MKKKQTRQNADEHLTEMNKGSQEKNPIRGKMMKSNAIEVAELGEEFR